MFQMCPISPLTPTSSLPFSPSFLFLLYLSLLAFLSLSLSPRLCGRGGKVTRSTLGRLLCAELLQVQGIICCFGKGVNGGGGRGVVRQDGGTDGRMDGAVDG